jgi:hypothetical protein
MHAFKDSMWWVEEKIFWVCMATKQAQFDCQLICRLLGSHSTTDFLSDKQGTAIPQLQAHGNSRYSRSVLPSAVVSLSLDASDLPKKNKKNLTHRIGYALWLAAWRPGVEFRRKQAISLVCHEFQLSSRLEFVSPCLRHTFTRPAFVSLIFICLSPFAARYNKPTRSL